MAEPLGQFNSLCNAFPADDRGKFSEERAPHNKQLLKPRVLTCKFASELDDSQTTAVCWNRHEESFANLCRAGRTQNFRHADLAHLQFKCSPKKWVTWISLDKATYEMCFPLGSVSSRSWAGVDPKTGVHCSERRGQPDRRAALAPQRPSSGRSTSGDFRFPTLFYLRYREYSGKNHLNDFALMQ